MPGASVGNGGGWMLFFNSLLLGRNPKYLAIWYGCCSGVGRASKDGMGILCVQEIGVSQANVCFCTAFYISVIQYPVEDYIL